MTVTPSAFWRAQLAARKAAAVSRRAVSSDSPDQKLSSASFSSRRVPIRVPSVLTGSGDIDTANRDKNFTRAKMQRRMEQIEESVARYLHQLDSTDRQDWRVRPRRFASREKSQS